MHIIRDGRDVALSLRSLWFSPGPSMEAQARQWAGCVEAARRDGAACPHYLEVRYEQLVAQPETTLRSICDFLGLPFHHAMLQYYERTPERLAEHHERRRHDGTLLVSHAERLQQQARVMQPPDLSRVQAWRRHMSQEDRYQFETVAGDLLADLGYVAGGPQ